MRLRYNSKAKEYLLNSPFLLKHYPIQLNENTVLEIGMGKGEMITQLALLHPNITYIGIEKNATVAFQAAKKAQELNLKNFFIVCDDLKKLSDQFIGNLQEIWLTFSDPWPKKRHYKRRLTYHSFLAIYQKLLNPQGILKIKTDNDQFFNWSQQEIINFGARIVFITNDLHQSIKNQENIPTGYEIKWSNKGKKINYMEVKI